MSSYIHPFYILQKNYDCNFKERTLELLWKLECMGNHCRFQFDSNPFPVLFRQRF